MFILVNHLWNHFSRAFDESPGYRQCDRLGYCIEKIKQNTNSIPEENSEAQLSFSDKQ